MNIKSLYLLLIATPILLTACGGDDGNDGFNSLIRMADEPPGANCINGGVKIETGLDANSNGVLDDSEVSDVNYTCGAYPPSSLNTPPISNAGTDQKLSIGTLVQLDGSNSYDADGDSITYNWYFSSKPVTSLASLNNATLVDPTFLGDVAGSYVLSLEVNDGELTSFVDQIIVTVEVLPQNNTPVARAGGDQILTTTGSPVTLNGTSSYDPDGDDLTYSWSFISKPNTSSAILDNESLASPSFVPDLTGDYTFNLVVNDGELSSVADTVVISIATGVSGIISNDTTWYSANSPYLLTGDVQVAYGATLQIDPGVSVISSGYRPELQTYGVLNVVGTQDSEVKFKDVWIAPGTGPSNEPFDINIDHAEMNNGTALLGLYDGKYGSISLTNSILIGAGEMSLYMIGPNYIEKNIFISSSISISSKILFVDGDKNFLRNNVFYGSSIRLLSGTVVVEYNSFLSTDMIAIRLSDTYPAFPTVTAINNYWNATDIAVIDSMTFDKNDDLGAPDYITYLPILMAPHPNTPDATPYIP